MGNSNNKPEKQSKEDYLKNSPAILKINKLYEDMSKIEYEKDLKYFARWQYYEPMGMDFNDRFELDKEAYIKTYHENGVHDYKAPFNETILIKKLIKNLEKAEHPYIQEYVEFLSKKLNTQNAPENKIHFIVAEYALTYIFDLYSNGQHIPINRTEGGFDKKQITSQSSFYNCTKKPDSFYREVKRILERFDINKSKDLQHISKDWSNAVLTLSKDRNKIEQYLKQKELL